MISTNNNITDLAYHFENNVSNADLIKLSHRISFSYEIVNADEIMRPDLIAKRLYGNENFDWLLCIFNGFTNNDFKFRTYFRVPDLTDIYLKLVK